MSDHPLVSVCIANYNGLAIIAGCIQSVLDQDCDFQVEILVHDDASTDDSAALVARDYPDVCLIRSDYNVGFCVANNRMVAQARGSYVLLLNNDAELQPDALRALLDEANVVGKPAILSLPQYDFSTGELIDRGCLLDPFFNPVPNLDQRRREVAMVIGACLWIPKQLWGELGGFPEWFGSIAEDMLLCCRCRLSGFSVRVTAASGYFHRVGRSFGGGKVTPERRLLTSRRRRALSERNKTFVMVACCPTLLLVVLLPIHLLALAFEGCVIALFRKDVGLGRDIYLSCFRALWGNRRRLLDLRKVVRSKTVLSLLAFLRLFRFMPYKLQMLFLHGLPDVRH